MIRSNSDHKKPNSKTYITHTHTEYTHTHTHTHTPWHRDTHAEEDRHVVVLVQNGQLEVDLGAIPVFIQHSGLQVANLGLHVRVDVVIA